MRIPSGYFIWRQPCGCLQLDIEDELASHVLVARCVTRVIKRAKGWSGDSDLLPFARLQSDINTQFLNLERMGPRARIDERNLKIVTGGGLDPGRIEAFIRKLDRDLSRNRYRVVR